MTIQFLPPMVHKPPVARVSALPKFHDHTPFDTSHSIWLLWTSDQPVAETSTWQHTTLTRDRRPYPGRIRNHNRSKGGAAYPRLKTARPLRSVDNPTGYVITSLTFLHNFEQSPSTRVCVSQSQDQPRVSKMYPLVNCITAPVIIPAVRYEVFPVPYIFCYVLIVLHLSLFPCLVFTNA
jgi:hypothetical protein